MDALAAGVGAPGMCPTWLEGHVVTLAAQSAPLQVADDLINEAIAQLDGFEASRAAPLVGLAKFIGYRQN